MKAFRPGTEPLEERSLLTTVNPVITWNSVALQAIANDKLSPPVASRDLAIIQASVYDAVNSVVPTGAPYLVQLHAKPNANVDAAAIGAAYQALKSLIPDQTALFNKAFATSIAALPPFQSTTDGVQLGAQVAVYEVANRANDGSNAVVPYTPNVQPGFWRPTPPAFAPALLPQWPNVTPFVLKHGNQFQPGPPPALSSAEYVSNVKQVEAIGSNTSAIRTPDQTQIAKFWADGAGTYTPPGHWNAIAGQIAAGRHDSTVTDARIFGVLDLALADAGIAAWSAKYAYNLWRPITAIRQADPTQSPGLTPDPTWTPQLTTPNFPSYVSGHSTFSAAASTVLGAYFGKHVPFTTTSESLPGVTRSFSSFKAAAEEAGASRIYGGIHFPIDNTNGLTLGHDIGLYTVLHAMRAK